MPEEMEKGSNKIEAVSGETVNLSQVSVREMHAELVRMSNSVAYEVTADEMEMRRGAILQVQAENLTTFKVLLELHRLSKLIPHRVILVLLSPAILMLRMDRLGLFSHNQPLYRIHNRVWFLRARFNLMD